MGTRFGAGNQGRSYTAKLRLLVSCLFAVILILVVLIVFMLKNTKEQEANATKQNPAVVQPIVAAATTAPVVEIVVAAQRIEEGMRITDSMLATKPEDVNRLPEGAYRSDKKPLLIGMYTRSLVNAHMPIVKDNLTRVRPISALNIPAGYRAVTIHVDRRSSVEGWARPNTRVDVLWTFKDRDGKTKVATIIRFVKILSVAGQTGNNQAQEKQKGGNTVTLLVTAEDARKIELARNLGVISLSLVGDEETPSVVSGQSSIVDIGTILGKEKSTVDEVEVDVDGVMYSQDPDTGAQIKWVLVDGRWKRDGSR